MSPDFLFRASKRPPKNMGMMSVGHAPVITVLVEEVKAGRRSDPEYDMTTRPSGTDGACHLDRRMSQPGTKRLLDALPLQKLLKQYLSEGQAGQRSHLMQVGAFLVVSAACPAMDPQGCRLNRAADMATLRFPSSSLADIACARRADGDLLFWRVRSGVQSH